MPQSDYRAADLLRAATPSPVSAGRAVAGG
jgi:hypothetical protein